MNYNFTGDWYGGNRIRELKTHASEILGKIKENRMRYIITHRGHPIAAIIPLEEAQTDIESQGTAWDELVQIGE